MATRPMPSATSTSQSSAVNNVICRVCPFCRASLGRCCRKAAANAEGARKNRLNRNSKTVYDGTTVRLGDSKHRDRQGLRQFCLNGAGEMNTLEGTCQADVAGHFRLLLQGVKSLPSNGFRSAVSNVVRDSRQGRSYQQRYVSAGPLGTGRRLDDRQKATA